jgi:uncharacterized protein YkwD
MALDSWLNCIQCGHRYKSFISACPRCSYPNHAATGDGYAPAVRHGYHRHHHHSGRQGGGKWRTAAGLAAVAITAAIASFLLFANVLHPAVSTPEDSGPAAMQGRGPAPAIDKGKGSTTEVGRDNNDSRDQQQQQQPSPLDKILLHSAARALSLDELRQHALQQINKDRADFGLPPVKLSDNEAAQVHAQDVLGTRTISHWTTGGEKPYMTYSRLGGTGSVSQNVAVEGFSKDDAAACRSGLAMCTPTNPVKAIDRAERDMLYNDKDCCDDGHRDNILDPHHTHVSIGIAYDKYFIAYVQNFENQYVSWSRPITYDRAADTVSMAGTLAEDGVEIAGINLFYDPLPASAMYEKHKNDTSYGLGEFVAIAAEPPPPGSFYEETGDNEYVLAVAHEWHLDGRSFEIAFPMDKVHEKYGSGAYTVVVFAKDNSGKDFEIANATFLIEG